MTQEEAGARVLAWCEERGLLEKREPYRHTVARVRALREPYRAAHLASVVVPMDELKEPALEALRSGRVRYHPESQHRFAIDSLENAPDWNISRQIWWGHQLPVWYCPNGHITVAESEPETCAECGSTELERDPDVLDTWFSSALWPFATLGWPDDTPDLRRFYPGDFNITAREIIRLWENRMIFSGLELVGEIPFRDVIIHSTVLAHDGRRMSKSLGTGVDPLDLIGEYGTDATRYGLMKMSSQQDARLAVKAIEEGRRLANKLWNVSRLIIQNAKGLSPAASPRDLEERWILARIERVRADVEEGLAGYDFAAVVDALYHLTFDDFCDWYAEAIKPRLYAEDDEALGDRARRARAAAGAPAPGDAARDRGDLDAAAGPRARGSSSRRGPSPTHGSRTMPARSSACRRRPRSSGGAASRSSSARRTSAASSPRSCGPSASGSTATAMPRSRACAARSPARRECSRTSASCRTRRTTSSLRSGRSSSATAASSLLSRDSAARASSGDRVLRRASRRRRRARCTGSRFSRRPVSRGGRSTCRRPGEVEVPVEKDVPAWIVAWRGQTGAALARLGDWPDGARVDAIFLVDSVSGDCCVVSRLVPPPASG